VLSDRLREAASDLRYRFRALVHRDAMEHELDDELRFHIDREAAKLSRAGAPPDLALRQARLAFGGLDRAKEASRDARGVSFVETTLQDLTVAIRGLRRQPAFLLATVATLALGIGANTAMFSVVNSVLLKPLAYHDPDRLVVVWPGHGAAKAVYQQFQAQCHSCEQLEGVQGAWPMSLTGAGAPQRLLVSQATTGLFDLLGAHALLGRTFHPGEQVPGHDRVAVLSYALWAGRFGADSGIIGRPITLDGVQRTVIGVMDPGFAALPRNTELYVPATMNSADYADYWWVSSLSLYARLRPGVTAAAAQAEFMGIVDRVRPTFSHRMPDAWGKDLIVAPMQEAVVSRARPTLVLLVGAVALVLLVACVNVANLVVGRTANREHELALRTALGAAPSRLVRQLLTESMLLGVLGGVAGVALAAVGLRALVAVLPANTPRIGEIRVDGRVLVFTATLAILTGVAFGLLPALGAVRASLRDALGAAGRTAGGAMARRRASELLVVAQIALAVILVTASGLVIKSFLRLQDVDPGFHPEHVIAAEVPLPSFTADSVPREKVFYASVLDHARTVPGVSGAAVALVVPLGGAESDGVMDLESRPVQPGESRTNLQMNTVSADYFSVMGIPVLRGRPFTDADRDGAPLVAIVDATAAKTLWPNAEALGQRIKYVYLKDTWITVVGVVGAIKYDSLSGGEQPSVYLPIGQSTYAETMNLVLRSTADAGTEAARIRAAVAAVNPDVPVGQVRRLTDIVGDTALARRSVMLLLSMFAAVALLLGAVGIYGVVAYAVTRRTREIGVRLALGAVASDIVRMVAGESSRLVAGGVAIGLAGAFAATRLLSRFLFGVAPHDPWVFAIVPIVLALTAVLASVMPTARAVRVDPVEAIRSEG